MGDEAAGDRTRVTAEGKRDRKRKGEKEKTKERERQGREEQNRRVTYRKIVSIERAIERATFRNFWPLPASYLRQW